MARRDKRLQCQIIELGYQFGTKHGRAYFPKDNCCDMKGIIDLFTGIDSLVELIETFADGEIDTIYGKRGKKWEVLNFPYPA